MLLSGAYAFSQQKKEFLVALAIALPGVLLELVSHFITSDSIALIKRIAFVLFLAYVLAIILSRIFRRKK